MKMLICGVGGIVRELLRQLGDEWEISLVDKRKEQLAKALAINPEIKKTFTGDPSSPVVLEQAEIDSMDYVLGLSRNHKVNHAVAEGALAAGVRHIAVLVGAPEDIPELRERGVHVLLAEKLVAGNLYHYLQNPRLHVTPLTLGQANLMEIRAEEHPLVVGKPASHFDDNDSRLVGVFRGDRLVFPQPDTRILRQDRLILLGASNMFEDVCGLLECDNSHFPLAYGPGMLVAVPESDVPGIPQVLAEGQYLARSVQVKSVTVLNGTPGVDFTDAVQDWPQHIAPEIVTYEGELDDAVREASRQGQFGLVVIPPLDGYFLSALAKPAYVSLAHDVGKPLLVSKGSPPYERILVPFSGTSMAELALEVAVDLAEQVGGRIVAAVIEEPEFLTGEEDSSWKDGVLARLKELSHMHKTSFEVVERRGNPIKEVLALSEEADLLVLGAMNRDRGLFSPNVGQRLTKDAQCSVLLMAF